MTDATSEAGTVYTSGAYYLTPVDQSLVFCVVFCGSLVVHLAIFGRSFGNCLLAIVLSVHLRLTASDYSFDILKLFLLNCSSILFL